MYLTPVARAEQSKTNLENKLNGKLKSVEARSSDSDTPTLTSEIAQNDARELVEKLSQSTPLESAQSQSGTGGLQCEQKGESSESLEPAERNKGKFTVTSI